MKVARYFERRLVHSVALLIMISVVAFAISQLAPGNFLDEMKLNPQISAQTIAGLRVQYGLDQPLPVRYVRWVKSVAVGDFGYSLSYNLPVSKLIWERLGNTLLLGATSMLFAWALALPCGIWSGFKAQRWLDRIFAASSTVLLGTPELALALLLILIAAHFGNSSANLQAQATGEAFRSTLYHLATAAVVLAGAAFPILFRHIRSAMNDAWHSPFVQAARGHGIGDLRLLLRHALPAAANPLISLLGLSLGGVISGSFLVEVITGWPGVGPLFLDAIYARDFQVVMAVVMLFSILLIVSNLVADLLLYAADPRVRAEC
jgi:peptide/nickel transport system permease protein